MTVPSGFASSPGIDAHTGEIVFTEHEMEQMLRLTHSLPDPDDQPGYSPDRAEERLDRLTMAAFLGLTEADKVVFLNRVTVKEAAVALMWVDDPERGQLLGSLSAEHQEIVLSIWSNNSPVSLSA